MRATGRRIGRIVGQLDDLYLLVRSYCKEEPESTAVTDFLDDLRFGLNRAQSTAEKLAEAINERDGRGK